MKPSCVQTNNNKLQTIKCKLTSLVCAGRSFNFIDCYCLGAIWSLYHRGQGSVPIPAHPSSPACPGDNVFKTIVCLQVRTQSPQHESVSQRNRYIIGFYSLFEDTEQKVLAVQVSGPWAKFPATMVFRTTRIVIMWLSCNVDTPPTPHQALCTVILWGRVLTSGIPVANIFIWKELVAPQI